MIVVDVQSPSMLRLVISLSEDAEQAETVRRIIYEQIFSGDFSFQENLVHFCADDGIIISNRATNLMIIYSKIVANDLLV